MRLKRERQAWLRFSRSLFAMTRAMAEAAEQEAAFMQQLRRINDVVAADYTERLNLPEGQRVVFDESPIMGSRSPGSAYLPFIEFGTTRNPIAPYLRAAIDEQP